MDQVMSPFKSALAREEVRTIGEGRGLKMNDAGLIFLGFS
jgi:hypothetical protein